MISVTTNMRQSEQEPIGVQETNHRLANSLQLLSTMVSMSAREVVDPAAQDVLTATHRRIEAIGRLHRHLYSAPPGRLVNLADYLVELGADLEESYRDSTVDRHVLVDADPVLVSPDDAIAVGILVSELVGNACKYAYEPRMPGDIRILLLATPTGGYRLIVEDRGAGKPIGVPAQGTGLGARLIDAMAARLRGRSTWQNALPGTRFVLSVRSG